MKLTTELPAQVQAALEEAERQADALTAPPPPPEPEPPPPEPPPPEPPVDDWKHKYETLQGIHRADVARLSGTITAQEGQIADLNNQLAAAKAKPEPKPAPQPLSRITAEDTANFGEDLIDVIKRAAAEIADSQTAELREQVANANAEIARLTGSVKEVDSRTGNITQRSFYSDLDRIAPDWREVNQQQPFLIWLGQVDDLSGAPRQDLLDDAVAKQDAERVGKLIAAWKATIPPPPPTPQPRPDTLAARVEPSRTPADRPPEAPDTPPTFTTAEVDKFYKDLTTGVYKGREAEAQKLEAAIDRASAEGRII